MKPFPHYSQHAAMDCGPTCLRMVSAFYGKHYSLEGLREKSFITREGVSILGISEAAERLGLRSICVQVSYEMLQEAPLPCIVHWNQQHFVVVYKLDNKHVWVADPGAGKLKYTREEFCRCWLSAKKEGAETGVALLLEPTPEFYAREEESQAVSRKGFSFLYSYLRPSKQLTGQLLLGLLLGSMIQLMLPFLTQSIVDFGINNQNLGFIYLVLIAQLMLTFSSSAVEFIRGWILLHLGTRINIALISDFLIKLMKLPMGYFDTKMTGDILQRINDHTRIQNFLTGSSLSVVFSMFNLVVFGIVLLLYSGMIFLIFMGGSALYVAYVWLFMKKRAELDHKRFAQQSANQSTVVQLVNGMQEIKLSACERQKRWEWERIQARLFKVNIKSLALRQYQDSGAVFINQTKNIVITGLVASLVVQGEMKNIIITVLAATAVINGEMTLGAMLAVQYIIGQLNSPINDLIIFARDMQDARLSMNRLSEVRDKPDEENPADEPIREIPTGKDLRIENLSFKYDPLSETPTLDNICLDIKAGGQTAIVGMSGSGKTTVIRAVLGLLAGGGKVTRGDILFNGKSLLKNTQEQWRNLRGSEISMIFQDSGAMMNPTRKIGAVFTEYLQTHEKISKKDAWAKGEEMLEKMRLPSPDNIMRSYPFQLSGGMRQRVGIAMGMTYQPKLLLADEPTSALDVTTQAQIVRQMELRDDYGTGIIVVTHNLGVAAYMSDYIVVMKDGHIEDQGDRDHILHHSENDYTRRLLSAVPSMGGESYV